jgi:manganese transport system permease protein
MMDLIRFTLENRFFQNALLAGVIIGFSNGFFSGFVNLRRQALSVSALSHTMLPGIALGIFITGKLSQTNAFLGAIFAAMLVGLGSLLVSRSSRIPQSTALAVLYTSAFAAGVAALPFLPVKTELEHWLFGNILAVSPTDLYIIIAVGGITLLLSTLFMRPLLLTLFEPNIAAAQGVPTRSMQYMVFTLLILMLVASLQSVGCSLSVGLLVAPGATMLFYTNNTTAIFWGGALLGASASVVGVLSSAMFEGISPGPAILIILGAVFVLSYLFSPKYGIFSLAKVKHKHG